MVGMIVGAKRYILFPPNQCASLGIHTDRDHPLFRHSSLNLGQIDDENDETEATAAAKNAMAVETVLKAGEILFIPSYWFHYIIGLQKNAQCNVRSGVAAAAVENGGGGLLFGGASS
ncbi:MAG: hypothetical protein SGARI_005874, partial [Bacillariaceae sp.]